ncbi:MAG: calcium:proton antiporter [Acidiferrobacterales bacterium]
MNSPANNKTASILQAELPLWIGILVTVLFMLFGNAWLADLSNPIWYSFLFVWLFVVILWLAFAVVRHAESLAVKLGEPYGTLILTVSVISIEVIMISAVMLTGADNPTLARDTLLSVFMIVLNGMLGITLLVGGLRHHEQSYNLQGASAYLGVIIPLAGLGLILPRYMTSAPGGEVTPLMAGWLIMVSVGLYVAFLWMQTLRHSGFFQQPPHPREYAAELLADEHGHIVVRSLAYHALLLPLTMLPIILLSKDVAILVEHGIATLGAPQALGGFLVAILVLSPEGLAAIKAALANKLQRTMNISLGSTVSTIGLTIPAVLGISLVTGKTVELGLDEANVYLLLFTLLVAVVNFSSERTNVLMGVVHLVLFLTYVVLIFD